MTHGSLFSGVGGFDLAAQWMGWENVLHCEINPFGRRVLEYYWPNAKSYEDITKTDFTIHKGTIDVLTGGFPCQPFSLAGKRKGTEDERHLWPEMLRAIREIKPRWVVGENVFGLVNWDGGLVFEQVQADLENEGYEVQPYILPAAGVNAPHRRDRVWFVAHANYQKCDRGLGPSERKWETPKQNGRTGVFCTASRSSEVRHVADATGEGLPKPRQAGIWKHETKAGQWLDNRPQQYCAATSDTNHEGLQRVSISEGPGTERRPEQGGCFVKHSGYDRRALPAEGWQNFPTQPPVRGRNDGVSAGLAGITVSKHRNESIKAYGNAIVPQVVYRIFKAIEQWESWQQDR